MAKFRGDLQVETVARAKRALVEIVALVNSGASKADSKALEIAGSALVHAERWIRIPTEMERSFIRQDARAILETLENSGARADRALVNYANAILAYSYCYYDRAWLALARARLLAE